MSRAAAPFGRLVCSGRALPLLLLGLALLAWFGTLGWRDLITPDEGRYSELSRAMLASGDWISPRLNGFLYFEKPPLQYWATAIAFALFGLNDFAARLWPALAAALAVLALWWTARRVIGEKAALYAACVLGSSAWWIGNSHFVNLDASLSAALGVALVAVWYGLREAATPGETRAAMLAAWLAMALAMLSKGLVGIVLPGMVLVVYTLWSRDLLVWRRLQWGSGPLLFLAVAAPWFILVSLRHAEFAHFFFIEQHFTRYLTHTHRPGPWWYFLPLLLIGLVPWTTLLPGALRLGLRRETGRFQGNRLLLTWAVVIFVFFSISGSKLPSYILPIFPALALLVGQHALRLSARRLSVHALLMAGLSLAGAVALVALTQGTRGDGQAWAGGELAYRNWIAAGLVAIALFCITAAIAARRARPAAAIVAMAFGGLIGTQLIMLGHQTVARDKTARELAAAFQAALPADAPVFTVSTHDQSLPYYLRRPVTMVNYVDEFATGQRIEPGRNLPTEEAFAGLWRSLPAAGAYMRLETFQRWQAAGLPMRVIYRDPSRVGVIRPPS
jgi:4-amino-4-deoxy-L-arabinose transferase-like glycosyltransferase